MAKYILIPESLRESLVYQLNARRQELERELGRAVHGTQFPLPGAIEHAPTIDLPELHYFRDEAGYEYMVCAWSEEDARRRLASNRRVSNYGPFRWTGSEPGWPGYGVTCLGKDKWGEDEDNVD